MVFFIACTTNLPQCRAALVFLRSKNVIRLRSTKWHNSQAHKESLPSVSLYLLAVLVMKKEICCNAVMKVKERLI